MAKSWLFWMVTPLALACSVPRTTPAAPETAAASSTATTATAEADKPLPRDIEALDLSAEQRRQILALRDDLKRDLTPLLDAGRDFARAVAVAARTCKPDSSVIGMEAEYTVRVGEQVRGKFLDGVDRFHRILTPAQRRKLSQRLLEAADRSENERDDRDSSRTKSIGEELDLSVGQMFAILLRVQALRSSFEEQIGPLRGQYRNAVAAFADDDFKARNQTIADAPVVELGTHIVRDAFRVFIPILQPKQCDALGRFISEKIED